MLKAEDSASWAKYAYPSAYFIGRLFKDIDLTGVYTRGW